MTIRLSEEEFGKLVDEAIATLPEEFRPYMENVTVEIQPMPSREFMRTMDIDCRADELLGFYHGVPLTEKSVSSVYEYPERIYIFQRNIESFCDSREEVVEQVRETVLHEIGHHFGMDEDDLDELGFG